MTAAEQALWRALRFQRVRGLSFRRQHPLLGFIVDFYCPARKLCIEVDGAVHDEPDQSSRDEARSTVLNAAGYRLVRFRNEEVLGDLSGVLHRIRAALDTP